jgi:SAM-dependent methyltransferase
MDTTVKFSGKAEGYAKFRPSYAAEFIDYLADSCSLTNASTVADVGSGTGILTKQLLDRGFRVLAVEPNADMRNTAESQLDSYTKFISVSGTAEATTLEAGSVDLIVAAQAFHWFDQSRFQAECRRALKPQGRVCLVWNSRDENSPIVREIEDINGRYCPAYVGIAGGIENEKGVFERFFAGGMYEFRAFRNDAVYDLQGFIGRNLSGSYAPQEDDGNYKPYVEALADLFAKYCNGATITVPSWTRSYVGYVSIMV